MNQTILGRGYHRASAYLFAAAFLFAILFAHLDHAPRVHVYVCALVEVACVVLFALWGRWLLFVSGIVLIGASLM